MQCGTRDTDDWKGLEDWKDLSGRALARLAEADEGEQAARLMDVADVAVAALEGLCRRMKSRSAVSAPPPGARWREGRIEEGQG